MTADDKPLFVAALNELAALKPGAKLSGLQYDAWWNAMRATWSLDDFRRACAHLAHSVEFMPNPFHFEQLRRAGLETAGEAWQRALAVSKTLEHRNGWPQEKTTADAVLDAAVRSVGGYRALAMATTDSLQFLERRFAEHFEAIRDAETTRQAVPQIAGPVRHGLPGATREPQPIAKLLGAPQ